MGMKEDGKEGRGKYCGAYLHTKIRIRHPAINSQFSKCMTTILLHCVKNGFGLETCCFEGCACDVAFFCVHCDADCEMLADVQKMLREENGKGGENVG